MQNRNKHIDTPSAAGERDDALKTEMKPHPFSFKDDPLTAQIVEAINLMGGVGNSAEEKYQAALGGLSLKAREVVPLVVKEYARLPEDQYLDRWSLVHLLAELKDPSALPALDEILSSSIPQERSKDPHSFSSVGEEIMIRTTSVEAVTRLAADGNADALKVLAKHARHENFSIKRSAIQGFLGTGGKDARDKLLEELPKRDHHILDIRRADVREVPQAEGGLNVVCRDTDDLPPREIVSGDDRDDSDNNDKNSNKGRY